MKKQKEEEEGKFLNDSWNIVLSFFILLKPTFEIIESFFNCCLEFPTILLSYHHHKVVSVLWVCSCSPLGIVSLFSICNRMERKSHYIFCFSMHSIFRKDFRISLVESFYGRKHGNFCRSPFLWEMKIYSEKYMKDGF